MLHRERGQVPPARQPRPEPEEGALATVPLSQIDVIRPRFLSLWEPLRPHGCWARASAGRPARTGSQRRGTKLIVTYHPAYLLRDPARRKKPGLICRLP